MPDGLHELAIDGNCKRVAELIAAGADVNGVNAYGNSPLYSVLVGINDEPSIDEYRAIILLLEAGANPLQPHPGNEWWKVCYPLFAALENDHLAQVLLLLWYVPEDYKMITMVPKKYRFSPTFQRYIEMTGEIEAEKGRHRDYVRWINETAADAKQVRELCAEAKRCLEITPRTVENGEKAARCYKQAAQIYQKHEVLEDRLVYYPPSSMNYRSATPEQLRALLKDYYRQKKLSYLEKEFNCTQLVERQLTAVDEESFKHHVEIIDRLIELSKLLVREADFRFYLGRVAEIIMRFHDRRVSEATTVSDDEVAVELDEDTSVDNEEASLLDNKPATTSSIFSGLRRRRAPDATTTVSQHNHAFTR